MIGYLPVLTKFDFVRRYHAGEFGNRCPSWETLEAWRQSGYSETVHIRNRIAGGKTWYNIRQQAVEDRWQSLLMAGYSSDQLYISAMGPHDRFRLFQGEVTRLPTVEQPTGAYLWLFYTTVRRPMRIALAMASQTAIGVQAKLILCHYLCPNSYEWLWILLERYPSHVIEFSTYECCWGTLPNFNTIFWEVRAY